MMPFMSFQMNVVFDLMYTFHHSNEITTLVKRHKGRNKQNESTKFEISFLSKFLALKFCSTSPPGGNQVDGLPPVVKFSRTQDASVWAMFGLWTPAGLNCMSEFHVKLVHIW